MTTGTAAAHRAIEAVWRLESARIIAGLTGLLRDVGLAEELAQDALVAALEQWPAEGIPANPGAWLMLTAKHRAIDRIRRNERLGSKLSLLGRDLETAQHGVPAEFDDVLDEGKIDDDLLRLMFVACHPVLSTEARIALGDEGERPWVMTNDGLSRRDMVEALVEIERNRDLLLRRWREIHGDA